jgi:Domain of unknown function (DUF4349)
MERGSDRFDLVAELEALRPEPDAQFVAYLDNRAAAHFPRGGGLGDLIERVRLIPPRRVLAIAGACAVAVVAVATGAIVVSNGERSSHLNVAVSTPPPRPAGHPHVQFSAPVAPAVGPSAASAEGFSAESSTGPYASQAGRRDIERSARIVIGADPSQVRVDSGKVFDAVHAAHGIILDSSIREGNVGDAGATFELLIPSAKLGDALADLSAIGKVRSRHESTADITAPTVSLGERLQDARAAITGLLLQLASASSDEERAAVETQLRAERARAASLRSRLNALRRHANFSRVSVRIETSEEGSVGGSGDWGIDDGLHAAGRVLTVVAGVIVVGLAGLVPLALALLLATLAYRAWLRRARNAALS